MWRGGRPFSSMSIRTRTLSRAISSMGCSMVVIRGTEEFAHLDAVKADNAYILWNVPPPCLSGRG